MATKNTVLQYSFATGTIAPGIRNRKDWERIDAAISEGKNGTVTPSGGFAKRPGFRFINECLHHDKPIRKVTFRFSKEQVYELEFGDQIMRFYKDGGLVLNNDDTPYVLETPYTAEEAQQFTAAQERDAIFFAHWDKPLKQLTRYDHNNWVWSDVFEEFDEEGNLIERIGSPEHVGWFDNASDGHNGYEYAVTAYKMKDGAPQESINYTTVFSDPDTVDFIGEVPQNNIVSCLNWRDAYQSSHGNIENFPSIPAVFDLRSVSHDQMTPHAPTYGRADSRLNQRIFDVMKLMYPAAAGAGTDWFSVPMPGGLRDWGWFLYDRSERQIYSVYYLVTEKNNKPANSTVHQEWRPYVRSYNNTSVMLKIATDAINGDRVAAEGKTKTAIYNEILSFVNRYNEANSQKISNHIKWSGSDGADGYYVYRRLRGGTSNKFWLVADAESTITDWIDEDVTETEMQDKSPIAGENTFISPGNYPALVTFYQQRMVLGCTKLKPTTLFGSRTGIYRDHSIDATDDSSGYEFKMAADTSDPLVAILPLYTLAVLTNGGDFISTVTGAMNASNVNFNQKSYNGASSVRPVILGDSGLYVPLSGKGINSMAYSYEKDGFRHDNILFSTQHYTRGKIITGLAFQRDPINLIWALLNDGTLLSCLYIPEQGFSAWSRHETDGFVKSINMIPTSDGVDVISAVVERTLGDDSKRQYIEYLESMLPYSEEPNAENSFYMDSGLSGYSGTGIQTITGLDHLEGREVAILADNSVVPSRVVENGTIRLDEPAKVIHIGLPYEYYLKTLRFDLVDQTLRDTRAQITEAVVEVMDTRDLEWSGNAGEWKDLVVHHSDDMGEPALQNGDIAVEMKARQTRGAYMEFRSRRPLPSTINSLVCRITRGDN